MGALNVLYSTSRQVRNCTALRHEELHYVLSILNQFSIAPLLHPIRTRKDEKGTRGY